MIRKGHTMNNRNQAIAAIENSRRTHTNPQEVMGLIEALNETCPSQFSAIAEMEYPTPLWKYDETRDGKYAGGLEHSFYKPGTRRNPFNYKAFTRQDVTRHVSRRNAKTTVVKVEMVNLRLEWFDCPA